MTVYIVLDRSGYFAGVAYLRKDDAEKHARSLGVEGAWVVQAIQVQ
jgi:hypothetical protein